MFLRLGNPINIHADLVIGEGDDAITVPAASLQNAATRTEYGITEVADAVRPDERFYWVDGTGNATPKDMDSLRVWAISEIKRQRQTALDTFPRSAGISEIYAENLAAAQAVKSGQGGTTTMRDGSTALEYLTRMAAGMAITAAQFADYVLLENSQAAVKAREIEQEYVRLAYTFVPGCTFAQVQTVVSEYQVFCQERTAP